MSDADDLCTRSGDEALAEVVRGLSDDDLARPSAAEGWDVSQVLGHLGSMAENSQAGWQATVDGKARRRNLLAM